MSKLKINQPGDANDVIYIDGGNERYDSVTITSVESPSKNMLDFFQTDMEIDVMKDIIANLPRADVWSLYRDREFRLKKISEYWAERLEGSIQSKAIYPSDDKNSIC